VRASLEVSFIPPRTRARQRASSPAGSDHEVFLSSPPVFAAPCLSLAAFFSWIWQVSNVVRRFLRLVAPCLG
jgi:hypothetical protein